MNPSQNKIPMAEFGEVRFEPAVLRSKTSLKPNLSLPMQTKTINTITCERCSTESQRPCSASRVTYFLVPLYVRQPSHCLSGRRTPRKSAYLRGSGGPGWNVFSQGGSVENPGKQRSPAMLTIIFLLIVSALGLGFDWHEKSAEETRKRDNANTYTKP